MKSNESDSQRSLPAWAVVPLTVTLCVVLALVIYSLSMLALYIAWFELWLSRCPNRAFHYIAACVALGSSMLSSRTINRRLRGRKGMVRLRCPYCGLQDCDPGRQFCPQCGEVVVGMLRFFTVRDWAMAALNFLVLWLVLSALVPWVLRCLARISHHADGFSPQARRTPAGRAEAAASSAHGQRTCSETRGPRRLPGS